MTTQIHPLEHARAFRLRFASLYRAGRGFSFPCDQRGVIDEARLAQAERDSLAEVRAKVGSEYAEPQIEPVFVGDAAAVKSD